MNPLKVILLAALCLGPMAGCTLGVDEECGGPYGCDWSPDASPIWNDAGFDQWPPDAAPIPGDAGTIVTDATPVVEDGGSLPTDGGDSPVVCSSVTVEAVCIVIPECEALYQGIDCTCDSDGVCACAAWEFALCR